MSNIIQKKNKQSLLMKHQANKLFFLMLLSILFSGTVPGQNMNTAYFMFNVPQRHHANPALQPRCNFYLGLPAVSPLMLNYRSSALSIGDVIFYNEQIDSLITFLHPLADKEEFLSALGSGFNSNSFELSTNLLSTGQRIGKMYFSYDITIRESNYVNYPTDLFEFALYGSNRQNQFDFSNLGVEQLLYTEFSVGASRDFLDLFTAGVRGKFLLGLTHLDFHSSDIQLTTSPETDLHSPWILDANFDARMSAPFLSIPTDSAGYFEFDTISIDIPEPEIRGLNDAIDYVSDLAFLNPGFAIDLGVEVHPLDWLSVSASFIDLGFIKWKEYTYKIVEDGQYDWEGIEMELDVDAEEITERFLDSLEAELRPKAEKISYRQSLFGKLYLGADFHPVERLRLGVLSRTVFIPGDPRLEFTFSANYMPINMFSITGSYSIMDGRYDILGLGLALRTGPLNMYLISDNAPTAGLWLDKAQHLNLRLGLNIMFGCRKVKKKMQDLPLIE